jgi:hypothetical protein
MTVEVNMIHGYEAQQHPEHKFLFSSFLHAMQNIASKVRPLGGGG